jgi:gamma-glutamylcyclotransferase (GGCT)/AIG2-like uncharacterized protein YtfP
MTGDTLEWYFAYGSNLDRTTFCGRRRMQPSYARRAHLRNFAIKFDLAVDTSNRGVANIVSDPTCEMWGVVYQISRTQIRRLDRSEGVHRGFYRRIPVVITDDDANEIATFSYASTRDRQDRLPSARYLGLIVNGAIYHGLPQEWINKLRAWPLAVDERKAAQPSLF